MNKSQAEVLSELLNKIDPSDFPFIKGNTIHIGKTIVRPSRGKYAIFDIKENCMVCKTFSKHSAVAIAKRYAKTSKLENKIKELDDELNKHYNDCLFYMHTMNTSSNPIRADVAEMRYDISFEKSLLIKEKIDKFIFDDK